MAKRGSKKSGGAGGSEDPPQLVDLRARLKPFLDDNPEANLAVVTVGEEQRTFILRPWDDSSLALRVPDENDAFIETMNALLLPKRFTAMYHKDTRQFEIIWTAYHLPEKQREVVGRKFKFSYLGKTYKCSFGKSSDRLITVAKSTVTLQMSNTSFRNLQSFKAYSRKLADPDGQFSAISEPISFWIEKLDWDDDAVVELVNNLNFYLNYYDFDGPTIALHQSEDEGEPHPRCRYISGKFPSTIAGKRLDNNLLSFWSASEDGDSARRFQYYYRIIEYASFFYLEGSAKLAVKRILSSPDAIDDIQATTDKLMTAFQMSKLDEYAKFSQLLQDTVDPKILWREMKGNIEAFSNDIKFDGGFVLKAIISSSTKESTFIPKGVETFTRAIRDIRNALSHGRDFKSASVIIPTARNLKALQPWVHLIAIAAGQVVLYKDVT